ncbi:hypothetical protein JOQ06_021319, partial [Pogonophryne albipinna]
DRGVLPLASLGPPPPQQSPSDLLLPSSNPSQRGQCLRAVSCDSNLTPVRCSLALSLHRFLPRLGRKELARAAVSK